MSRLGQVSFAASPGVTAGQQVLAPAPGSVPTTVVNTAAPAPTPIGGYVAAGVVGLLLGAGAMFAWDHRNKPSPSPATKPNPVPDEYRRLRGAGVPAPKAFDTAKFRASWIGTVGDVNFLAHGGGVVYPDHGRYTLEYVQEPEGDFNRKGARWTVYRVDLETEHLEWAEWKGLASFTGQSVAQLQQELRSADPMTRAQVVTDVGAYHGWHELDGDPLRLTKAEAEARYGETV